MNYSITKDSGVPAYIQLYNYLVQDIVAGIYPLDSRLPSKRIIAEETGVSLITVEHTMNLLSDEGYIETRQRSGYFVIYRESDFLSGMDGSTIVEGLTDGHRIFCGEYHHEIARVPKHGKVKYEFPFSVLAKVMRKVLADYGEEILIKAPNRGCEELRRAISNYLARSNGIEVSPRQIIIGAGTEYLYTILIQLLGLDKIIALENPSYPKIRKIYQQFNINQTYIDMEKDGISISKLKQTKAEVIHLSPSHQFPTGSILSIGKRYELLSWANQGNRYIIEDDYDSEFRFQGLPIPSLQEIDTLGKVIYINTFSKSLSSTLRISYMILPPQLLEQFEDKLNFYSNTVSNLQQYTLAYFIKDGYFEKHLNRMRLFYQRKRDNLVQKLLSSPLKNHITIHEDESGLHFIMTITSDLSEEKICQLALENHLLMTPISHYYHGKNRLFEKSFIVNYANISEKESDYIINVLSKIIL